MLSYLYRCHPAPLPLAPPPSLLVGPQSSLNALASRHAKHPIKNSERKKKNSGK